MFHSPGIASPETEAPSSARGTCTGNIVEMQKLNSHEQVARQDVISSRLAFNFLSGSHPTEESEFAEVLGAAMRDDIDSSDALREYSTVCKKRASEIRKSATSQMQRAARSGALLEQVEELEAEAATWQLLWHLHGVTAREFPGGKGGNFVDGAGLQKTVRQHAADLLFQDDGLNRCGRIIAWLEALAGQALDEDIEPPSFVAGDGLWNQTKSKIAAGLIGKDAVVIVNQLDPDSITRQRPKKLCHDNIEDNKRLLYHVWKLLRSGRVASASGLCQTVGQHWRALALTGGGPFGPLPVGTAALEADENLSDVQDDDLANELDSGMSSRWLWRLACAHTADTLLRDGDTPAENMHLYEAAVFGVMACSIKAMLPVCHTWQDKLWAHLRCWLDVTVDVELIGEAEPEGHVQEMLSLAGLQSSLDDHWPSKDTLETLPTRFEDAVADIDPPGTASSSRFTSIQKTLMLGAIEELISETLSDWIITGSGAMSPTIRLADSPSGCSQGQIRFASHLVLSLWSLGLVDANGVGESTGGDVMNRVLQIYIAKIIDDGSHSLVPIYSCHLKAGLRWMSYHAFFEQLIAAGQHSEEGMEACRTAYKMGEQWFGEYSHHGDIRENEMAVIALRSVQRSRFEVHGGPVLRAQSVRWLCFGGVEEQCAAIEAANTLCREFVLGGSGGISAADVLLNEVLPLALQVASIDDFVELLITEASSDDRLLSHIQELKCWQMYVRMETEFASWRQMYVSTAAEHKSFSQEMLILAEQTLPLLIDAATFVSECRFDYLVEDLTMSAHESVELAVVVGPELGIDAPDSNAFPAFEDDDQALNVGISLQTALSNSLIAHQLGTELQVAAGSAPVDMPRLASIAFDCTFSNIDKAVLLLSQAIKGQLHGIDSLGPLSVVNVDAPLSGTAALCRCICYPRIALMVGAMREAVAFMGYTGTEGGDVVEALATKGLATYCTALQLRELLESERATEILQMRNQQHYDAA